MLNKNTLGVKKVRGQSEGHVIKPGMETEMKRNETAHALLVSSNYVISELRDGRGRDPVLLKL